MSKPKWTVSTDLPWNDLCVRRDGVPSDDLPNLGSFPVKLVEERFVNIDDLDEATRTSCLGVIDTEVARLFPDSSCAVTWDGRRLQVMLENEHDALMIGIYGGPTGLRQQIERTVEGLPAR